MTLRLDSWSRLFCAALLAPPCAMAQLAPSAGDVLREVQRPISPTPELRDPQGAQRKLPAAAPGDGTVFVRRYQVEGAALVPAAELEAAMAPFTGQALTLGQMEAAIQAIVQAYRAKGWFANVFLPQQDVVDGTVRVRVVEGRLSGIDVQAEGDPQNIRFLEDVVTARLQVGQPLGQAALERGLLIANDVPRASVTGVLQQGADAGDVRLRLEMSPSVPQVLYEVEARNYGARATGHEQVLAGLEIAGNQGFGDRLFVRALASEGTRLLLLGMGTHVGTDGLRVVGQASLTSYRLLKEFRALDANGETSGLTLTALYPVVRSERENLTLSAGPTWRRQIDRALQTRIRDRRFSVLTLGADVDRRDTLGGEGLTTASLALHAGDADLDSEPADALLDAAGPKVQGSFAKLGWSIARLQALPSVGWSALASFSGQLASKNLDSSERMVLGGPSGVRAYPVGEAAGDAGWIASFEVRKELPERWQAFGFADVGRIRVQRNTYAGSATPNQYGLAGAGFGARWAGGQGQRLDVALALPVGGHPASNAGNNQDGSSRGPRLWLRAQSTF